MPGALPRAGCEDLYDRLVECPQYPKEEQEIATACKVLIQNAIVLWNYLYLSQRLSTTADPNDRQDMLEAITGGSIIAWAHVNMQGEYDFTRPAANDDVFDMPSILALKLG